MLTEIELREYADKATYRRAVVGFVMKGSLVLLGQRIQVTDGLGQDLRSGYGGKVGDSPRTWDETCREAMVRELLEETGRTHVLIGDLIDMGRVRFLFPHKPNWQQDVTIYLIKKYRGEPVETESMRPCWYHIDELPLKLMWPDNQIWVPLVLAEKRIDAVFLYGSDGHILEKSVKEL